MAALDRRWLGTDCLLLGLYTLPDVAAALRSTGADEQAVRPELERMAGVLARQGAPEVRFGELARDITRRAADLAARRGAAEVAPEHLLLVLTADDPPVRDGMARRALDRVQADIPAIRAAAEARIGPEADSAQRPELAVPSSGLRTAVFERAPAAARGLGHKEVGTEHLLLGLYSLPEVADLLEQGGAAHSAVRVAVRRLAPAGSAQPTESRPAFGRYSERAQKIIMLAQAESRRRGAGYVATEHLLLALLSEDDAAKQGVARKALDRLGVDVPALRARVEAGLPEPKVPAGGPRGEISLTPSGKALVMEHAIAAARAMGHAYVGTEHLLLAVYDASEPLAKVLEEAGAVREGVEAEVLRVMGGGDTPPELPLHDAVNQAVDLARKYAQSLGHTAIQPWHLLVGLLDLQGGAAHRILDLLEIDAQALRAVAEAALPKAARARAMRVAPEPNADVKAVISTHAVAAARALGASRVGTEHVLLGLYGVPAVAEALAAAGAAEDAVRVEVARVGRG